MLDYSQICFTVYSIRPYSNNKIIILKENTKKSEKIYEIYIYIYHKLDMKRLKK